ncbi:MAG: aminotransferase class V-fold PLP-dependent enzyme [Deltaproteobacteria bacterium]
MIYFNNAATSYPKPEGTAQAMGKCLAEPPSNLYRENVTQKSSITGCREKIAKLFHFADPARVVFCSGATEALNIAVNGLAPEGGRVVTTILEHNAVLRPLYYLRSSGVIKLDIVPCRPPGDLAIGRLEKALPEDTRLVVVNHVSNVTGAELDIAEIYRVCESREIPLVIDASQSAGAIECDFSSMPLAAAAFTGHKALLGPKGVGGLIVGDQLDLRVWKSGGTGIRSDSESMPEAWPVKYEAGTLNEPGIAGLEYSVDFILARGISSFQKERMDLTRHLVAELERMEAVTIYSEQPEKNHCGIVCFNINDWPAADVGYILKDAFDIRVRTGLHCAPLIHKAMGTFPGGAIRVSFSASNHHGEVETFIRALRTITGKT